MKRPLDSLRSSTVYKRYSPIIRHYGHSNIISIGTALFGVFLIVNLSNNVIERVMLFPGGLSFYLGLIAILLGTIKTLAVFKPNSKIKKWSLMGITLIWLIISWAYMVNGAQNTGFIMAGMIVGSCYVELWRGDYGNS